MKKMIALVSLFSIAIATNTVVAMAAPVAGPIVKVDVVKQHSDMKYVFLPRIKEELTIVIVGNGQSDVDCTLLDNSGNVLVQDVTRADICVLHYTPQKREMLTLSVVNYGDKDDQFEAYIN